MSATTQLHTEEVGIQQGSRKLWENRNGKRNCEYFMNEKFDRSLKGRYNLALSIAVFLILNTIDNLDQVISYYGGFPVHCKIV